MNQEFALGVDLGWLSQLEEKGVTWIDEGQKVVDPIVTLKEYGSNTVRLRVFVNPPEQAVWKKPEGVTCLLGYCDKQSVLQMSQRIKKCGMKLMIDIHYSDHFADPVYQHIPKNWMGKSFEEMKEKVAEHTREVLQLLKDHDITPEWVQIGNEINSGILIPTGGFKENPQQMVGLLNEGYNVAKEIFPDCKVVTHVAGLQLKEENKEFFDLFFKENGKTDIIGFSYYPFWHRIEHKKQLVQDCLLEYVRLYHMPIMICEIGGPEGAIEETYQMLADVIDVLEELPDGQGKGIFFWEPEVGAGLLPDHYPLGASLMIKPNVLRITKALSAYKTYRVEGKK